MTVLSFGGRDSSWMLCGPATGKPGQRVWGLGKETEQRRGRKVREQAEDGVITCRCT